MPARSEALFAGTKVPVQTLLDWLKEGETVAEFLRYFPAVTREQALDALAAAGSIRVPLAPHPPLPRRERGDRSSAAPASPAAG